MNEKCSLKAPFIMKMLDEFQPDWRKGADVTQETKHNIMRHVEEKYRSQLDELLEEDSISQRSIEKTIGKIRANLGYVAKSTRKTYPKRDRSDNKVPEKKKTELYEMLRLLRSKYPYSCDEIIDACKKDADIIEIILKFHKKYPEEDIAIRESIQSYEIPLYNPYEVKAKQVRWVIPHTNKQLIFGRTGEIPHHTISLYGCIYARL